MKRPALSNKQRAFVEHYLMCWNASEAARRAGYKNRANTAGAQLMSNNAIKAAIDARLADLQMSADEIKVRFTDQARGSMADFINTETDEIDLDKAETAGRLHLLKSFSHTRTSSEHSSSVTMRIELYDAQTALGNLARMRGMYLDKTALTDPSGENEYGGVTPDQRDRAIAAFADAVRAGLLAARPDGTGAVGAAERAAVGGDAEPGG